LAFRFADKPAVVSRHLPSLGPLPRVAQPPTGRLRVPQGSCGSGWWWPRRRRGWRRWRRGRVRWRYWRPQHLVWSLGGGPMTLWPFQPLLHAPIVYHPPGGGPSPCFPRGGRGAGPGLAAGPASPPLRATLGRRLCISRVASSFTRSLSIRSRTARISKAELCSDHGPADATDSPLHTAGVYAFIASPPDGVGPGAMSLTRFSSLPHRNTCPRRSVEPTSRLASPRTSPVPALA